MQDTALLSNYDPQTRTCSIYTTWSLLEMQSPGAPEGLKNQIWHFNYKPFWFVGSGGLEQVFSFNHCWYLEWDHHMCWVLSSAQYLLTGIPSDMYKYPQGEKSTLVEEPCGRVWELGSLWQITIKTLAFGLYLWAGHLTTLRTIPTKENVAHNGTIS